MSLMASTNYQVFLIDGDKNRSHADRIRVFFKSLPFWASSDKVPTKILGDSGLKF